MSFPSAFQDNIIARLELTYVRRVGVQNRLLHKIGSWMTIITCVCWLVFVYAVLWGTFPSTPYQFYQISLESLSIPISILGLGTLILHFATLFRTLTIASESIMREKRGRTWATLILTGVDTQKVVLGKWWATMRAVWRDYAWLMILRAGAVVGVGLMLHQSSYSLGTAPTSSGNVLVALLLSIPFTLCNLLFTAAAGVLGGLLTRRRDGVATLMAQAVRMTVILVPVVFVLVVGFYLIHAPIGPQTDPETLSPMLHFAFTLIDNGLLVSAEMVYLYDPSSAQSIVIALITFVFYGVLTFGLLRMAQYFAQCQGVLSPGE